MRRDPVYRQLKLVNAAPRPIIGFDLNGVLADANTPLLKLVKQKYNLEIRELTAYGELKKRLAPYDEHASRWLAQTVNDPDFILSLRPFPDALKIWGVLPDEHRIVTGHQKHAISATERWLTLHGFTGRCDFTTAKEAWARQTRARYVVEDSPIIAATLDAHAIPVRLINRSYNQGVTGPHITRIASLEALLLDER